jgi:hypothetical protein
VQTWLRITIDKSQLLEIWVLEDSGDSGRQRKWKWGLVGINLGQFIDS